MIEEQSMQVHVLASGSRGNATLVTYKGTSILIDAGISCKRVVDEMKALQLDASQLDGIFLTHEHTDHVAGVAQLLKRFSIPLYTRKKTWQALASKIGEYRDCMVEITDKEVSVGHLTVQPFSTYHDAVDPCGFSCYGGSEKMSLLTDTGMVDRRIIAEMEDSSYLVLEANHDLDMLRESDKYPMMLKRRIAGNYGHLNNEQTAEILLYLTKKKERNVILAHRSADNNTMATIERTLQLYINKHGITEKELQCIHAQPKECVSLKKENL